MLLGIVSGFFSVVAIISIVFHMESSFSDNTLIAVAIVCGIISIALLRKVRA
jgi:hypothetical protein